MSKLFRIFVADMKALSRKIGTILTRSSKTIGLVALALGAMLFAVSLFVSAPNTKDDLLVIGLASILTGVVFLYKTMRKQGGY